MVTMALMGILAFMMIMLLEKILPTSRTIRGIENSTIGLYHGSSAIEQSLATMNYKLPGKAIDSGSITLSDPQQEGKYTVSQNSKTIPVPGKGSSEYDSNWNRINAGNPVQLRIEQALITSTANFANMTFDLRMPKLGTLDTSAGASSSTTFFTGSNTYSVVNFTISNGLQTYSSDFKTPCTGASVQNNGVTASRINVADLPTLGDFCMKDLNSSNPPLLLKNQLSANANFCLSGCTIKFSVINKLENAAGGQVPYLEYRIRNGVPLGAQSVNCMSAYPPLPTCGANMELPSPIALPFTTITAEGVAYGFRRVSTRNLQQLTTSEELDFAVFQ